VGVPVQKERGDDSGVEISLPSDPGVWESVVSSLSLGSPARNGYIVI